MSHLAGVCRETAERKWSGRWDSNPRLDLGKVPYYPYTTAARIKKTLSRPRIADKIRAACLCRGVIVDTLLPSDKIDPAFMKSSKGGLDQPTCNTLAVL